MRLVDADALKDPLELQRASYARIGATERAEAYANALWEIEQAPTVGGWVSVKDRMPEKQIPVLVYVPPNISGQDEYIGYVGMAYHTKLGGGWWAGTDGAVYGAIGFIHEPTHWMPLPKPQKEATK